MEFTIRCKQRRSSSDDCRISNWVKIRSISAKEEDVSPRITEQYFESNDIKVVKNGQFPGCDTKSCFFCHSSTAHMRLSSPR